MIRYNMTMNDPHPWSAIRWLTEKVFDEVMEEYPDTEMEFAWESTVANVEKKWPNMSEELKEKWFECEVLDEQHHQEEKNVPQSPSKKKKRKKDPNMPKQGMSAFFMYMNHIRETIKAQNPDFSVTDISKEVGRRWQTMSEKDKEPFKLKQQKAKEIHDKEMIEYKKGLTKEGNEN